MLKEGTGEALTETARAIHCRAGMAQASGWAYHAERAWNAKVRCGLACDRAAPWVIGRVGIDLPVFTREALEGSLNTFRRHDH